MPEPILLDDSATFRLPDGAEFSLPPDDVLQELYDLQAAAVEAKHTRAQFLDSVREHLLAKYNVALNRTAAQGLFRALEMRDAEAKKKHSDALDQLLRLPSSTD